MCGSLLFLSVLHQSLFSRYKEPSIPLKDYVYEEARYTRIINQNPEMAASLLEQAQEDVNAKWTRIETLRNL